MMQPAGSGPLALPHRQVTDLGRAEYTSACPLPQTTNGDRSLDAADTLARPVKPADLAQARLFEEILQAESAQLLNGLAYHMAGPLNRLKHPDIADRQPSPDLTRTHARIDEVHRLLEALRGRFPHAA